MLPLIAIAMFAFTQRRTTGWRLGPSARGFDRVLAKRVAIRRKVRLLILAFVISAWCWLGSSAVWARAADQRYRELLQTAAEPLLTSRRDPIPEEYRLIYDSAFGYPIIIRVSQTPKGAVLHAIHVVDGRVFRARRVELKPDDWQKLMRLVRTSGFWELPAEDDVYGSDGTTWFIEGRRGRRYYAVSRWCASFEARERGLQGIVNLGRWLMKLSEFGIRME